ncbi:hypothetical protein P170DRAFT_470329 [Aspergillus steynii IBT 23096]|uniref:LysM domain-containing protein n=1 Tax=Aspergillus steynii IBT 23096 TaxID=1392250 RepID=A0A2I2GPU6_9EURO|nr:uncharacterized protein P170DRAFT_470329 [Aspergillus steynii IBT 23096]PLB54895.1 hypothetical protein P170DRAFT_470329 [Aspergillus steynii IBT 23096]
MAAGKIEADRCDDCSIKQRQFVAGSPMYAGNQLRSSYTALTKSCSKTGFPLAPSTSLPSPSTSKITSPTPSVCSGKTYNIRSGDTCQSISKSQGVGTAQLLVDNGLEAYCKDCPSQGELCIDRTCTTHTVAANETCVDIGRKHVITQVQLTTWNPILGHNCRQIERSVGNNIWSRRQEMMVPGRPSQPHHQSPQQQQKPQHRLLSQRTWQMPGDYCNKVILKYSISLDDFLFLNKGVNKNCTNLFATESYCVSPFGSIDDYPGAPGYIDPSASYSDIHYSSYPTATYTPPIDANVTKLLPISPGGRKDCYVYVAGPELQVDVSGTFYASSCEAVAEAAGKTESLYQRQRDVHVQLQLPILHEPERTYRWRSYCNNASYVFPSTSTASHTTISSVSTTTTTSKTAPTNGGPPGPTQSGIPDKCNRWHLVTSSDENCATVAAKYGISVKQFYDWNPAVLHDCVDGFWKDEAYCVGVAK